MEEQNLLPYKSFILSAVELHSVLSEERMKALAFHGQGLAMEEVKSGQFLVFL